MALKDGSLRANVFTLKHVYAQTLEKGCLNNSFHQRACVSETGSQRLY